MSLRGCGGMRVWGRGVLGRGKGPWGGEEVCRMKMNMFSFMHVDKM